MNVVAATNAACEPRPFNADDDIAARVRPRRRAAGAPHLSFRPRDADASFAHSARPDRHRADRVRHLRLPACPRLLDDPARPACLVLRVPRRQAGAAASRRVVGKASRSTATVTERTLQRLVQAASRGDVATPAKLSRAACRSRYPLLTSRS